MFYVYDKMSHAVVKLPSLRDVLRHFIIMSGSGGLVLATVVLQGVNRLCKRVWKVARVTGVNPVER